jgi:8-hydroxy-5-deazaflavin:NADPH oxidoreductase
MKITTYGRGNVGGGLADLWEGAGHEVTRLGREGGDVADADVVLLAIPGGAVTEALDKLRGFEGKTFIDVTNRFGVEPPPGFSSNAEFVKAKTGGPTAKAFNLNYARLYGQIAQTRARPSNFWCGDDGAAEAVERLSSDAGYDPVRIGGIDMASFQEAMIKWLSAVKESIGLFFYRAARPEQL